jgi:hypothetical protein
LLEASRALEARMREATIAANHARMSAHALAAIELDPAFRERFADPKRLIRHQFQACSQNGEDGIIHEIFRRIGTDGRIFVEIGAGDGCENNTAFLLAQGWNGYWIDGNDAFLAPLKSARLPPDAWIRYQVFHVTRENIAQVLADLEVPAEFDLLSIDIDQNTYYIWEALSALRPRVIVIEYNAAFPPDIEWKVHYDPDRTWDGTQNFGASLKAYEVLGNRMGYRLVGCDLTGINAFFVRQDLVADHFASPFSASNHYEPIRYVLTHRVGHRRAIFDRI